MHKVSIANKRKCEINVAIKWYTYNVYVKNIHIYM